MTRTLKKEKTEKMSVRYFEGLNWWILAAVFVANIFFQLSEVSSSLFLYAGTFVLIGMLFILDKDDYIYLTVSLLSVLRFSKIFGVSVINIITFVYFAEKYIFNDKYDPQSKKQQLPRSIIISVVVFILFSLIFLLQGDEGIRLTLGSIKLLFFLVYMVDIFRDMKDIKTAQKRFMSIQIYYVTGVLIAIFVALVFNPKFSVEATRMSLSEGATNQLGMSLASCLAFVLLGITKVRNIKEWLILLTTAVILVYFCFETQSRTCIFGILFIFVSTVVLGCSQKKSRIWIMLMVVCVIVVTGIILFSSGTKFYENIMATLQRIINPRNGDISNNRFDIWTMYIEKLKTNPKLFFCGGTIDDYNGLPAHNIFIEILAAYGLIGTFIVGWVYVSVFYEIKKALGVMGKVRIKLLGFVPFVLVFFLGMASHTLLNTEQTVNFCLGVAIIYFYGEDDLKDESYVDNGNDTGDISFSKRKRYGNKNIRRMDCCYSPNVGKFRRS